MFKSIHPVLEAAIIFLILAVILAVTDSSAQDLKYCKNYQTGEIIVIEAGYPCPSPTAEL